MQVLSVNYRSPRCCVLRGLPGPVLLPGDGCTRGHAPAPGQGLERGPPAWQGQFPFPLPFQPPPPPPPRGASPSEPWCLSREPRGQAGTAGTQLPRVGRSRAARSSRLPRPSRGGWPRARERAARRCAWRGGAGWRRPRGWRPAWPGCSSTRRCSTRCSAGG